MVRKGDKMDSRLRGMSVIRVFIWNGIKPVIRDSGFRRFRAGFISRSGVSADHNAQVLHAAAVLYSHFHKKYNTKARLVLPSPAC